MNKALVIYDATGRIWSIVYGEEEAPQGVPAMFVDVPDGASLNCIDVTDPANPKAVFDYLPESDIDKLQKQVKEMETKVTEMGKSNGEVAHYTVCRNKDTAITSKLDISSITQSCELSIVPQGYYTTTDMESVVYVCQVYLSTT